MSLPIIFIHSGNASYLWFAIRQARIFNPDSEIILIGDTSNQRFLFVTRHVTANDYYDGAEKFACVYQHMSVNKLEFERFCFQRWFVLRDWMESENLDKCFLMDSDVMLYCKVAEESRHFRRHDMTLSHTQTPGNVFINNRQALNTLCDFLMSMYTDPDHHERLCQQYQETGIISDMTALVDFSNAQLIDIGDTRRVINGTTWDDNVNCSSGFEFENGIKKFAWQSDVPFATSESGERIKFNSIHFQGGAKKRMPKFASQFDFACWAKLIRSRSTEKARRYLKSLKKRVKRKQAA